MLLWTYHSLVPLKKILGTWDDIFYLLIYTMGTMVVLSSGDVVSTEGGDAGEMLSPGPGTQCLVTTALCHVMERDFKTLDGEGFQNTRKQMLARFFFLSFFFFLIWTIFKIFYWICYSVVSVFFFFFLIFWCFGLEAGGILAPWPGMEHGPPALESKVLTSGPPRKSVSLFKKQTKKTTAYELPLPTVKVFFQSE